MPLPMVHIEVAYAVADGRNDPDLGQYLLGVVAPDSIVMRDGWTRSDKNDIHLMRPGDTLAARLERIDGLAQAQGVSAAFLRGWVTHIAADSLWSRYAMHGYWDQQERERTAEERSRIYYRELDKVDILLFRSAAWREEVWDALRGVELRDFPGYLKAAEIGAWRDRLLRWYLEPEREPAEEPVYFTVERVRRFVGLAVAACAEGFRRGFARAVPWLEDCYAGDYLERTA